MCQFADRKIRRVAQSSSSAFAYIILGSTQSITLQYAVSTSLLQQPFLLAATGRQNRCYCHQQQAFIAQGSSVFYVFASVCDYLLLLVCDELGKHRP